VGGVRIDQHTVHGLVIELAMMVSVDGHLGMFQGLVNYLGSARAHHMGIVHRHPIFGVQSQPQPKWCDLICRVVSVSEPEIWRVCVRPLSGLSAGNLISANFSHQIGSRTHRAQGHRSTYICMDPLSGLGGILGIFGGSFAATVSSTSALFWHSSRPHHFFFGFGTN